MEFISIGGLLQGLSTNDIMNGISQPRNPMLAQIFFRLKHIESYGTGIRRIYNLYRNSDRKPSISVSENSFRITLPNMNFYNTNTEKINRVSENKTIQIPLVTDQMKSILDYLSQCESITEYEFMELLNLKRTRAYIIAKQMTDMGLIDIIGRGK
jgi:ATP-dependent DNA helicase RecG